MKFNQETLGTLNEHIGLVRLANGTITTPIAYLDLVLPASYRAFRLSLIDVTFSIHDYLAMVFSQDGGQSFINDTTNFDSYLHTFIAYASDSNSQIFEDTALGQHFVDGVMGPSYFENSTGPVPADYDMEIIPGNTSFLPRLRAQMSAFDPTPNFNPGYGLAFSSIVVNPNATIQPTLARANLVRITPAGNETNNPPTSGETIMSGSYVLWGIV